MVLKRAPWIAVALVGLGVAVVYASATARLAGKIALPSDDAYAYLTCAARGACAGSPSASWPALLGVVAKLVSGPGLVTAAFWAGALLYAITVANVFTIARTLGGTLAGVLASVATLAVAPFAWAALSGIETSLVAALWTTALLLMRGRETPGIALAIVLAALGLARHEMLVVVALVALAGAWHTTTWRGLAAWSALVIPALVWCAMSSARVEHAPDLEALRGVGTPLAIAFGVVWLVGVASLVLKVRLVVLLTPIACVLAGHVAAALPVFAIAVGCAAAITEHARARIAGAVIASVALAALAVMPMRASVVTYAQDASDLDRRITPFRAKFADATVIAAHDPGAVAYYSGLPAIALDGVDPLEGPGARFERLERLERLELRPSHFISSPLALGFDDLFGEARAFGTRGPKLVDRWVRGEVQWIEARWDHAGTGERPIKPHPGWRVVDRIDLADLDSEAAHHWTARVTGKQHTLLHRDTTPLLLDGGRTIAGGETFEIGVDPSKPIRLVLRTGGNRQYADQDVVAEATIRIGGTPLAIAAPRGPLVDVELELPATTTISVETDRPYRAFHWFVLQPL